MVLKLLNEGKKRVQVYQDFLEQLETEPNLLKRLLLAMSHGFLSTTRSLISKILNGGEHCHQELSKVMMMIVFFLCPLNCLCRILVKRPNYYKNILQHLIRSV